MASSLKRLVEVQESDATSSANPVVVAGVPCSVTGEVRLIEAHILAQETATPANTASQIVRALVNCDTIPAIVASNNATKLSGASPPGAFSLAVSGSTVRVELTNGAGTDIKLQVTYKVYG